MDPLVTLLRENARISLEDAARQLAVSVEDVAARMVRRETQDLERAFDKFVRRRSVDDFFGWIIEYYADFEGVLATAFLPVMMSLAQLVGQAVAAELDETPTTPEEIGDFVEEYLDDFAEGYAASSKGQIQALQREAQAEDPNLFVEIFEEKLKERIEEWAEKKALKVALRQAFQAGNGLVVGNYTLKGVRELVWEASGENCPYCAKLDGTIISIDEFFIVFRHISLQQLDGFALSENGQRTSGKQEDQGDTDDGGFFT